MKNLYLSLVDLTGRAVANFISVVYKVKGGFTDFLPEETLANVKSQK